jgi:hypothetical protein
MLKIYDFLSCDAMCFATYVATLSLNLKMEQQVPAKP